MAKVTIHDGLINPPPDSPLECLDPSRTVQDAKDECDINVIMQRYKTMGVMPQGVGVGVYGDFSGAEDFQAAQETIMRARAQFDALPSEVRARFKNDPAGLLAFVADKNNLEEAARMGLLKDEYKKVQDAKATLEAVAVSAPAPSK